MPIVDVQVPDIGDFSDVPVIGIMVAPGDDVAKEDPLIELESDKATMEVPSPVAGKVVALTVKEGDNLPGHRRRHLHRRLVAFQLNQRILFGDLVSRRHHDPYDRDVGEIPDFRDLNVNNGHPPSP